MANQGCPLRAEPYRGGAAPPWRQDPPMVNKGHLTTASPIALCSVVGQ